jgi:hypothetical protein
MDYQKLTDDQIQAIEAFIYDVLVARDTLQPIVDGEITRGHCVGNRAAYGGVPGKRKVMLKDTKIIATSVVATLNRAINTFNKLDEETKR